MGIPVIDFGATTSFASTYPVVTGIVIMSLGLLAYGIYWATRKYPKHLGKIKFTLVAAFVAVAIWVNWGMFKTEPSLLAQMEEAVQRVEAVSENGIEMAMLNDNPTPRAGDRLAFQEIRGHKCRFYGVVQPKGHVAINRRSCADNTETLISLDISLDKGVTEASGLKHYRAYLPGRVTERNTQ